MIGEIALGGGVLVTSYSHVVGQLDTLLQHDWHYVVLDEGHKIRNPDAQVTLAVKQVGLFMILGCTVNLYLMCIFFVDRAKYRHCELLRLLFKAVYPRGMLDILQMC